ncbi:cytochrome d ubiquinol oxidase subunit II [Corynebacterium caspium]|uniref:cytochrome d ubiquinol oxidase subunit II n=1 Tax=Corynebacterium caspium TaxID=234828 RepID=UPI0003721D8E|nr:cytochrome d ubiquinol oxidase subunit II [Corynebacterium caspium]
MFGLDLPVIWFILVSVLFAGYFLLEGFDFGVGILAPIISKEPKERNTMVATIGPVWDGNEVWVITAGGAIFAAFPLWYATLFSGFYLPLFLLLLTLIVRVIALEWRHKVHDARWVRWADVLLAIGSWGPALAWGLVVSTIVRGVPLQADFTLSSSHVMGAIFHPYALLGAIVFAALFSMHGLAFLRLKTAGIVRERTHKFVIPLSVITAIGGVAYLAWTIYAYNQTLWGWILAAVIALLVVGSALFMWLQRDGWSFLLSALAVLAVAGLMFGTIFPNVMPTSLADGANMTIWDAASNPYTLRFMTWVAIIMVPFVLAYQAWTYWVFSKRLQAESASVEENPQPELGLLNR